MGSRTKTTKNQESLRLAEASREAQNRLCSEPPGAQLDLMLITIDSV